ncbi:MAG: FecR domain-containing protein [Mucilaginibacter sp.]|uniref:FecR family protein n=1 Tax=Mucilaginibacter sp. TaxID=1882438 RepID=UPI0031A2839A
MTHQELEKLYKKYMSGAATTEERRLFEEYQDGFDLIDIPWEVDMGDPEQVEKQLNRNMAQGMRKHKQQQVLTYAASSLMILLITGLLMIRFVGQPVNPVGQLAKTRSNVIKPGSDKAILTLSNGSKIALENARQGVISIENNIAILKSKQGQVVYSNNRGTTPARGVINTMSTPRGGQYQLILADGTKVWLNAATSLKYPIAFTGNERVVELTGEAYFEVAHNPQKPFKVISMGQEVKVLGTHFNINAYHDNETTQTTLLEGLVMLTDKQQQVLIRPGEQATKLGRAPFVIKKVNINNAVAWKNGLFAFDHSSITQIMQSISLWYDVDIVYKEDVTATDLGGTISRYNNLKSVLAALQATGAIHFHVEGRRIVIMR